MSEKTELSELEHSARVMASVIDAGTPDDVGFVLLLFNFGPDGMLTHISSAERASMIEMMEECVQMLKTGGSPSAPVSASSPPQKYRM